MTYNLPTPRVFIRVADSSLTFLAQNSDGSLDYLPYDVRHGMSMAANLREALAEGVLKPADYRRAYVLVDSPVMILPVDEDDDNIALKYNFVYPSAESHCVETLILPQLRSVAAFAVNKDLRVVLSDAFADLRLLPLMASTWQYLMRRSMVSPSRTLYAVFHDGRMELVAFHRNRFAFVNSFDGHDAHDAVYFILGVWKQLVMDSSADELHILGTPPDEEWLTAELRQFIAQVQPITPLADYPALQGADGVADDLIITFHQT